MNGTTTGTTTGPATGSDVARRDPWSIGLAVVLGLLITIASACGIPTDQPEALAQEGHEDLLFGTSTTTTPAQSDTVGITLFFISTEDKLESVVRPFEANPGVNEVLQVLESPPLPEEQALFQDRELLLRTVVPSGLNAKLQAADNSQTYRTVRVDPQVQLRESLDTSPTQARLVVSQLVCTFLNLDVFKDTISGVELVDDRGPIPLTDSASQPIDGPATESNFGGCKTGTEQLNEQLESGTSTTTAETTSSTAAQN